MTDERRNLPFGPCADCFTNFLFGDPDSGVMFTWCIHNESGAFLNPKTGRWRIDVPVSRDAYFQSIGVAMQRAEKIEQETQH